MTVINPADLVESAYDATLQNGGVTLDARTVTAPTSGYAVALERYGLEVPESCLYVSLRDFVLTNLAPLAWSGRYLGVWVDNGTAYLDVVVIVQDRDDALELARQQHQIAVFHLDTATEVRV